MSQFNFKGPLQEFIEGMIREKQSLGYKYDGGARILYKFDQFCLKAGYIEPIITKKLIQAWIQKAPNESVATLQNRVSVVRQLTLYMARLGIQTYVLPKNIIQKGAEYKPYIFSNQEIAAYLNERTLATIVLKCR